MKLEVFVVLTGIMLLVLTAGCNSFNESKVCFKGRCFTVELARTPEERAKGLMYRNHLDKDKGMLFIFDENDVHPMWMKNTLIPLDIIWINNISEVVYISSNTQPCNIDGCPKINPNMNAKYVLEINAGISDDMWLYKWDKVEINISS